MELPCLKHGTRDAYTGTMDTCTTKIEGFPKCRIANAREAIDQAHRRMVRSAARSGQATPEAPSITVLAERVVSRCDECGATDSVDPETHGRRCDGVLVYRVVLDLEVSYPRPALAGWEFLAVIEPMAAPANAAGAAGADRNLLRFVPGATVADGELAFYRTCDASVCDHCNTRRGRLETFVVRADGSDAAVPAGIRGQARAAGAVSEHVGDVGKRLDMTLTIERVVTIDTTYGPLHIHTMRDSEGNALVWKTGTRHGGSGEVLQVRGTVKTHSEFRGEKQTELTRCKVVKCSPNEVGDAVSAA